MISKEITSFLECCLWQEGKYQQYIASTLQKQVENMKNRKEIQQEQTKLSQAKTMHEHKTSSPHRAEIQNSHNLELLGWGFSSMKILIIFLVSGDVFNYKLLSAVIFKHTTEMETTCYPGRHKSFWYPLSQIVLPSTPSQIFAYSSPAQSKHMLCDGNCGELKGQVGPDGSYLRLLRKLVVITATSLFIILERSLWIEKGCVTVKR